MHLSLPSRHTNTTPIHPHSVSPPCPNHHPNLATLHQNYLKLPSPHKFMHTAALMRTALWTNRRTHSDTVPNSSLYVNTPSPRTRYSHSLQRLQIPPPSAQYLTPHSYHTYSTTMASHHDTTMKQTPTFTSVAASRLEIDLRTRQKTLRSASTEFNKIGSRQIHRTSTEDAAEDIRLRSNHKLGKETHKRDTSNQGDKTPTNAAQIAGGKEADSQAPQRASKKTASKELGEGTGQRGVGEDREMANCSPPIATKSRSSGRRRALITNYSDEEGEKDDQQANQPTLIKGKALPSQDIDIDIDMQLVDVSPEHGGSSLRFSISNDEFIAAPNQAAALRLDAINLADATPSNTSHKSPRNATTSDNHSAKKRRSEVGGPKTTHNLHKSQSIKTKERIPSIDIVSHMWLGFPIHEVVAVQKGGDIIREHRTTEDIARIGTPPTEIIHFNTLRRAFPRVPQIFYPSERPDAVPGNHLHFTQLPRQEKVNSSTGLSEGFHVTIRFDYGFKSISRQEARGACMERLKLMAIPLGTAYSNPIDVRVNAVTKKWASFVKIHLQYPQRDGHALLQGNRALSWRWRMGT